MTLATLDLKIIQVHRRSESSAQSAVTSGLAPLPCRCAHLKVPRQRVRGGLDFRESRLRSPIH